MLKSHFLFYLLPLLALCQNSITDFDALDDTTTTTTTATPPPDPFQEDVEEDLQNLDEKLDELDSESQDLVIDYVRNGRKLYGDLRRRLVLYVMKFSPVQTAVEVSGDGRQIHKIEKIKYRFRTGLRIKYSSLKSRIDRLVVHLLSPIFAPFMLLQTDEIRPLLPAQKADKEPVTVAPQEISQSQSSFPALELFPSSLPRGQWPQFDQRWMSPQATQFSVPSFAPYYQPFQYYRG